MSGADASVARFLAHMQHEAVREKTLLDVLGFVASAGYEQELGRCAHLCKEAYTDRLLGECICNLMWSRQRRTWLLAAAAHGKVKRVQQLLSYGADVNQRDSLWHSALWHATAHGHAQCVQLLLAQPGADANETHRGLSLLLVMIGSGQPAELQLLLGADIDDEGADGDGDAKGDSEGGSTTGKGCALLGLAAVMGRADVVQVLLDHGALLEAIDGTPRLTPLMLAAATKRCDIARLLLDRGASVNATAAGGNTPLIAAAAGGDTPTTRLLLDRGADVTARRRDGVQALVKAVDRGHAEVVALLLASGADVNASLIRDGHSMPLVSLALNRGFVQLVEPLLAAGAPADEPGPGAPLLAVAQHGPHSAVQLLLKAGANLHVVDSRGYPPLSVAARCGQAEVIGALLAAGASLDAPAPGTGGRTALHLAAEAGQLEAVRLLCDAGAVVNKQDIVGSTPLLLAAYEGHTEVVRELVLKRAAAVDSARPEDGSTPLVCATGQSDYEMMALLLSCGANPSIKQPTGAQESVLIGAAKRLDYGAAQLLLRCGADVHATDRHGHNALYYAQEASNSSLVRLLESAMSEAGNPRL